jgi:hypothetical protein
MDDDIRIATLEEYYYRDLPQLDDTEYMMSLCEDDDGDMEDDIEDCHF